MNRAAHVNRLQQQGEFDLLVIGGGATGCGIALDAASRGLDVALVEKNDFAEGTSGRSTKLLHGGVRYLELAVKHLDREQYNLVRDGLRERGLLLHNAPHLTRRLPLLIPLYSWWQLPYIYSGLRFYDFLAGKRGIGRSRLLGRKAVLSRLPGLKAAGLKGGVLYFDGQFNDARTVLALAMTAAEQGAALANHVEVKGLLKERQRIVGAELIDHLSGVSWELRARGVINASGPFSDSVRQLDDPCASPLLQISSGIHLVLPKQFLPVETGMVIPRTDDGRILFVLPWEGHALVGTTDEVAAVCDHPRVTAEEISYLLRHLNKYLDVQVREEDILAAWSGLRPLARAEATENTSRLVRDHFIHLSRSGLLTVSGGKWTTYRRMAEDAVDQAVQSFSLSAHYGCRTCDLPLSGGGNYLKDGAQVLVGNYGLTPETARHLHCAYGDRAVAVADLAHNTGNRLLVAGHPYLEAEISYAAHYEAVGRAIDVLARRLPLALLDREAALSVLPRVIELLATELSWTDVRGEEELQLARKRILEGI
ncbi:MAG: FAD-dependent oxidoreductase [Desulfuromonadaceae bacterium]|jgi:glycerol-3-phosphate dehydrogenase